MAKTRTVIGEATDPDERIRLDWAETLRDLLAERDWSPAKFRLLLLNEQHVDVSRQTVEAWLSGKYAPRPHVQAEIGTLFGIPARQIFRIENAPKKAA